MKTAPRLAPLTVGSSDGPSLAGWHKIASFLECPKKYQYDAVRGVRIPSHQTPDYFAVGRLFHLARAHWFARHFDTGEETMSEIRAIVADGATRDKLPVTLKAEQQTLTYFEEYVRYWGPRPRPVVIGAEYDVGPSPLEKGDPFFVYRTARLDDVSKYVEAGGALCIGEAKTTGGSINDCVNEYTLNGQPLLQVLLWKTAPQGEAMHGPVAGVVLDVLQKGYGKPSKFGRVFIPTPDKALKWFAKNLRFALKAAAQVDKDADVPRNITSCTRMQGKARIACNFRELCMYGRAASTKYVLENGDRLSSWKPTEDNLVAPWE